MYNPKNMYESVILFECAFNISSLMFLNTMVFDDTYCSFEVLELLYS